MPNPILLEKYAELAVRTGVNVQEGQIVVLRTTTEAVELTRAVAKEAYKAGAKRVYTIWNDERMSRYSYDFAHVNDLKEMPEWQINQYEYFVKEGACFISIVSPVPNALAGVDSKKVQTVLQSTMQNLKFFREHTMGNQTQWTIVAASNEAWASKLFPEMEPKNAFEKLWEMIFKACRIQLETDSLLEWEKHNAYLRGTNQRLNEENFKHLHFKNNLGTDLVVELIEGHIWAGGSELARNGIVFNPNIPTEESFTMPNKFGTNGKVFATKPLNYQGRIIEDFWLEFKDGKVVDFDAKTEKETLRSILDFDEGARSIGEIALLSDDTPISQMNTLFLNTLYDENASCHMALGRAYPMNIKGGHTTPIEQLEDKGYNNSLVHVDFMFGSSDLEIIGTKQDGSQVIVFKNGKFAF